MALPTLVVQRTSSQTFSASAKTAVSWSTASTNSGPSSWWASGSPTDIVMPYAGPYLVSLVACWDEVDLGDRHLWLSEGTDVTDDTKRRAQDSYTSTDASEAGIFSRLSQTIVVPTAGTTYQVGVSYTGGANFLELQFAHPPAQASFTYLGGVQAYADSVAEGVIAAYPPMARVGALCQPIG